MQANNDSNYLNLSSVSLNDSYLNSSSVNLNISYVEKDDLHGLFTKAHRQEENALGSAEDFILLPQEAAVEEKIKAVDDSMIQLRVILEKTDFSEKAVLMRLLDRKSSSGADLAGAQINEIDKILQAHPTAVEKIKEAYANFYEELANLEYLVPSLHQALSKFMDPCDLPYTDPRTGVTHCSAKDLKNVLALLHQKFPVLQQLAFMAEDEVNIAHQIQKILCGKDCLEELQLTKTPFCFQLKELGDERVEWQPIDIQEGLSPLDYFFQDMMGKKAPDDTILRRLATLFISDIVTRAGFRVRSDSFDVLCNTKDFTKNVFVVNTIVKAFSAYLKSHPDQIAPLIQQSKEFEPLVQARRYYGEEGSPVIEVLKNLMQTTGFPDYEALVARFAFSDEDREELVRLSNSSRDDIADLMPAKIFEIMVLMNQSYALAATMPLTELLLATCFSLRSEERVMEYSNDFSALKSAISCEMQYNPELDFDGVIDALPSVSPNLMFQSKIAIDLPNLHAKVDQGGSRALMTDVRFSWKATPKAVDYVKRFVQKTFCGWDAQNISQEKVNQIKAHFSAMQQTLKGMSDTQLSAEIERALDADIFGSDLLKMEDLSARLEKESPEAFKELETFSTKHAKDIKNLCNTYAQFNAEFEVAFLEADRLHLAFKKEMRKETLPSTDEDGVTTAHLKDLNRAVKLARSHFPALFELAVAPYHDQQMNRLLQTILCGHAALSSTPLPKTAFCFNERSPLASKMQPVRLPPGSSLFQHYCADLFDTDAPHELRGRVVQALGRLLTNNVNGKATLMSPQGQKMPNPLISESLKVNFGSYLLSHTNEIATLVRKTKENPLFSPLQQNFNGEKSSILQMLKNTLGNSEIAKHFDLDEALLAQLAAKSGCEALDIADLLPAKILEMSVLAAGLRACPDEWNPLEQTFNLATLGQNLQCNPIDFRSLKCESAYGMMPTEADLRGNDSLPQGRLETVYDISYARNSEVPNVSVGVANIQMSWRATPDMLDALEKIRVEEKQSLISRTSSVLGSVTKKMWPTTSWLNWSTK